MLVIPSLADFNRIFLKLHTKYTSGLAVNIQVLTFKSAGEQKNVETKQLRVFTIY